MKKIVILIVLLCSGALRAQPPRIDSMVVYESVTTPELDIYGRFGDVQGEAWIDTIRLDLLVWSDTLVKTKIITVSSWDTARAGECGPVHVTVGSESSNIRMLTKGAVYATIFEYHPGGGANPATSWRYDYHSFFINHKNRTETLSVPTLFWGNGNPDTLEYHFANKYVIWNYAQQFQLYLSLDSINSLIPFGHYRTQFDSIVYHTVELCPPPMTAVMIYKGVTLSQPLNGSFDPDTTNVALHWVASQYFDTYHLQVSTDSNFTVLIVDTDLIPFQDSLPLLNANTTYYWRVSGTNIEGTSRWSDVWHFTTSAPSAVAAGASDNLSVSCYPNPARDELNISARGAIDPSAHVILYDLLGRNYIKESIAGGVGQIDVSNTPNGRYILGLISDKKEITRSVTIVH